ncbi:hypothetical protein [Paenibacillus sp. PL2-23]|uniref:hypothetical protein n=1 Tax=Paenibacillus sp. PL2-23 TaxID=2100729 RepID=UPI0030F4C22E
MSIQEKKNIVSLISSFVIISLYSLYVYQYSPFGTPDPDSPYRFWALFILLLIPVSIAARIIISISFSIVHKIATNEDEPSFADELDQLIELKATRNSHYTFAIGFILAMVSIAAGMAPGTMFVILIFSGFLTEVTDHASQLYYYRKGV